ncbi:MAG TPA: heme o synthase [Geobacteraceae bacterium]
MAAIDGTYVGRDTAAGTTDRIFALVRLAKPGIVAAVLLAGYAGMVTAARGFPEPRTAALCLASLLLAAAGAAMLNCILDLPLDRNMGRLLARVKALDAVGTRPALRTAGACIFAALFVALALNRLFFLLVLAAVIFYTVIYTLILKRRFAWGAIPGGIPGALPVLIGQAAVTGTCDTAGVILFAIILLWQPPHFWLLALRCRDEYRAAGVPVLPVARGESHTKVMSLAFTGALLPATLALTLAGCSSPWFAAVAAALWVWFLAACCRHAVATRRFERAFRASVVYLALLLLAVILDTVIVR